MHRRKTRKLGQRGATRGKTGHQPPPGPSQCHPSLKKAGAHGCLPVTVLRRVAEQVGVNPRAAPSALRSQLETALHVTKPNAEHTFLMALPLDQAEKGDLARRYLRPPAPQAWAEDPDMWLDSNNIAAVLNQYEDAYPEFEFMGPFPIDFAAPDPYREGGGGSQPRCLMNEICEFRVQKAMASGTKYLGIVYNLDPHFKSGSHWVANFVDLVKHRCYYMDSYGLKPPPQVERFMKWLTTQDPKMRLEYNSRKLQYQNTECGVYSIYFIIRMLSGDRFQDFTRRRPTDAEMLDLRDWLFSV